MAGRDLTVTTATMTLAITIDQVKRAYGSAVARKVVTGLLTTSLTLFGIIWTIGDGEVAGMAVAAWIAALLAVLQFMWPRLGGE
jgi:hypothetical protein